MAGTNGILEYSYETKQVAAKLDYLQTKVIVASGEGVVEAGQVLEQNGTTFKYEILTAGTPAGANVILLNGGDATSADVTLDAMCVGIFMASSLVWPTITAAQKNAAIAALRDRGLISDTNEIYA